MSSSVLTWVLIGSIALYALVLIADKIVEHIKRRNGENNIDKGDEN